MGKLVSVLSIVLMIGATPTAAAGETDLSGSAWLVDDVGGRGVVDRARTQIQFLEPGRVAGSTGCNRFFGPVEQDGNGISFGDLGVTRMACPEALMSQEQRFLEAMAKARRFELAHDGLVLVLYDDRGARVIELSRILEK